MKPALLLFVLTHFTFLFSALAEKKSRPPQKSLVLQWEMSHSRNRDQLSLIFKQDHVKLVTNMLLNSEHPPRLGQFKTPMTPALKLLEQEIRQYYVRLKQSTPVSSLIQTKQSSSHTEPHAPVLRINDREITKQHIYFKYLKKILVQQAKNKNWQCAHCAVYKPSAKNTSSLQIQRILTQNRKTAKKTFSAQQLNCLLVTKKEWECADPDFGIFSLKRTENKK